jgi:hypothetical protein
MGAKPGAWLLGVAMLGGGCAQAWAASEDAGGAGVVWRCWWDRASHVSCAVEQLPDVVQVERPVPALPGIAGLVRARPHAFRHRLVHIPLHTPHPFDAASMSTLAQAVICGGEKGCLVRFSADVPQAAELDRWTDPLFASGG